MRKINWKKIWKEFDKLSDAYDRFGENSWRYQKIIFYSVVNANLPSSMRLNNYEVTKIEYGFKSWFNKNNHYNDWPEQKKTLRKLIEHEISTK